MKQASYVAEPYVTGIAQMLEDIRNGHILIARFQRPLVWEMDAQIELLRSIRNGLPIGGILVWRTRGQLLPCHERIGRHVLRHHDPSSDANEQYVLDGFQRLSSDAGTLRDTASHGRRYGGLSGKDARRRTRPGPEHRPQIGIPGIRLK